MQIAYLILAHNEPELLKKLVNRLDQPGAIFFIHIDKKYAEAELLREYFKSYPNVTVLIKYDILWMGYKMVKATIDLLSMAYAAGQFKYFTLLSGQDYPIKSNSFIKEFFAKSDCDFIGYNRMMDFGDHIRRKAFHYNYYDVPWYNPRSAKRKKLLVWLYFGLHKFVRSRLPKRSFYKNMEPYFGPQWFSLTSDTVRYVLDFIDKEPGYLRFMQFTEGPDEVFFQTIILNSPRRENTYGFAEFLEWQKSRQSGVFVHDLTLLTFMDWAVSPGPATLDLGYYDELASSNKLFARKFSSVKSANLQDRIDEKLLNFQVDNSKQIAG